MFEKNLKLTLLLDLYGELLTDKQRESLEFYYDEDMSLAEIAEHMLITRQGVRDNIKRGETTLIGLEEKLGLAAMLENNRCDLDRIIASAERINDINLSRSASPEISQYARIIAETAKKLQS